MAVTNSKFRNDHLLTKQAHVRNFDTCVELSIGEAVSTRQCYGTGRRGGVVEGGTSRSVWSEGHEQRYWCYHLPAAVIAADDPRTGVRAAVRVAEADERRPIRRSGVGFTT
jgi:hypothetical protein